jgi:hypothetical protein
MPGDGDPAAECPVTGDPAAECPVTGDRRPNAR